jgi:hypothetical protein
MKEDKIEVGEYARDKEGFIFKVEKIIYDKDWKDYFLTGDSICSGTWKDNIANHSKNIIDLIEVGDYVNEHLVIDIAYAPEKAVYIEDTQNRMAHIPYTSNNIKSIVTKEQMEAIQYVVE